MKDAIKTFSGLSMLLKKASATAEKTEVKKKVVAAPAPKADKKVTKGQEIKAKAKEKKAASDDAPIDLEAIKASEFYKEVSLLMDGEIHEAILSLDQRVREKPDDLQVATARNLLINAVNPNVSPSVKRMVVLKAKGILMNDPRDNVGEMLEDIRNFNLFEAGPTLPEDSSTIQARLARLDECIDRWELISAAEIVADLLQESLGRDARTALNKLFKLLSARIQAEYEDPDKALARPRKEKIEEAGTWKELVSDAAVASMTFEEREERRLDLSQLVVDLPIDVHRARIVEGVPMVIHMTGDVISDRLARKYKLQHIVNFVHLFTGRMIGVPSAGDRKAEYQHAAKFMMHKESVVLVDYPMRRPDSDATWFPIIPFEGVVVHSVGFPDMVAAATARAGSDTFQREKQQANSIRLRAQREAFEASEAQSFNSLQHLNETIEENRQIAKTQGEFLKDKFGRADVSEMSINAYFEEQVRLEVKGVTNMERRWFLRQSIRATQDKYLEAWQKRVVALGEVRRCVSQVKGLNIELDSKRAIAFPSIRQQAVSALSALRIQ